MSEPRVSSAPTPFSRDDFASRGFEGFVPLRRLPRRPEAIPSMSGVYAVLRARGAPAEFLDESVGGRFKGRDPGVRQPTLVGAWIDGVATVYLGRARLLRRRVDELARFGRGEPVGHWGGRYLWQLSDHDDLLVAWQQTADFAFREAALLDEFRAAHGALPFANLAHPKGRSRG